MRQSGNELVFLGDKNMRQSGNELAYLGDENMVLVTFPKAFPKGDFPISNFPSGNFPKVRLGPLKRRRLQCGPSSVARMG